MFAQSWPAGMREPRHTRPAPQTGRGVANGEFAIILLAARSWICSHEAVEAKEDIAAATASALGQEPRQRLRVRLACQHPRGWNAIACEPLGTQKTRVRCCKDFYRNKKSHTPHKNSSNDVIGPIRLHL